MNWFNIAPGLYYIAEDFQVNLAALGILTSAFYIGVAVFQLPAGTLAGRYGNRITGGIGVLILGISVLASGFSFNIIFLGAMRLLEGMGSALFFSPAISTLKTVVSDEHYSFHVNIFNGAFDVGAGLGVIIWNYIDIWIGWRAGFQIAGIITIATAIAYIAGLSGLEEVTRKGTDLLKTLGKVIRFRPIWILAIAGLAANMADIVVGQFSVYYLETAFRFTESQAMISDAVFLLVGFFGGILGALMIRKFGASRKMLGSINAANALLVIPFAFVDRVVFIYLLSVTLGITTTIAYSLVYVMVGNAQKDKSMVAFSLSLVNFIQQAAGSLWPTVFGVLHDSFNYTVAWVSLGLVSLMLIPLLLIHNYSKMESLPA